MAITPAMMLKIQQATLSTIATWDQDSGDGDIFVGYPYRWEVSLAVTSQPHTSPSTLTPFQYDGKDIKVGDWIATSERGIAVRIYEIVSQDASTVVCRVEDVGRYNTMNDLTFGGTGIGPDGSGVVFQVDETGTPIVGPLDSYYMGVSFQSDLLGRFSYFNQVRAFSVEQAGHGLTVGDVIYLDESGNYQKLVADKAHKDIIQRVVGSVSSVGIPGLDYFTFKPRGSIVQNLNPELPADVLPGQFAYVDPVLPGKLTAVKPKQNAVPVYIRLGDAKTAIFLSGGAGNGASGPLGYNASSFVVDTLAERDALDADTLNVGDFAYVKNIGDATWGQYEVTAKVETPAAVTWTLIQSQNLIEAEANRIVSDDTTTFVETQKAGSLNKVVMGSNSKSVLEVEGSATTTKGETLKVTHVDSELQLVAQNTAGTGDVSVRVVPQGDGHVFFGIQGDGVVEGEKTFDITVRGGLGTGAANPGDLFLTGGDSPSGNYNGGNVVLKPGIGSGTGTVGAVQVVDEFDTPVLGFKSIGETSSNYIELRNGANNADPAINGVKISAAMASTSANVDIYLDPKGSGLVRVSDFATYSAALLQTGSNDALVTKSYVLGLAGLGEGEESTILAGVGLTDDNGVFNVNVEAATIGVDGVNNLIVKGSGNAGELLMSTGIAGEQAVYGKLNLSSSASFTGVLGPTNGGLGFTTFNAGDILVGNGTTLDKIPVGGEGKALFSTGASLEYTYVSKLVDETGASVIETASVVDPVNFFTATNAAADGFLELAATGTDANITVRLSTKGTGLLLATPGYSDNVGSNPDTIVTKGWVEKAISSGSDTLTRRVVLNGNWASTMNLGEVLPVVVGKDVYVTRAIVRVIAPLTGGGVNEMVILSDTDVVASAMESDVLAAGTYIVDLAETFASKGIQLKASFFAADGSTVVTPTGGNLEITITYKIR